MCGEEGHTPIFEEDATAAGKNGLEVRSVKI